MTDKPAAPTEPAANDVRIWKHCEVSGVVTGWEVSARKGFAMKRYDTEEAAYNAARMFAQLHKRDVWVTRTGDSTQPTDWWTGIDRPRNTEKPSIASAPTPASKPSSSA